jgi:CBS domain-containing protein
MPKKPDLELEVPDWRIALKLLTEEEFEPGGHSYGEDYLDAIRAKLEEGRRQWRRGDKLLEAFGYTRRRQTAIDLINGHLKQRGMHTVPELTTAMPLNSGIGFYLDGAKRKRKGAPASIVADSEAPATEVELANEPPAVRPVRIGNLPSAERVPEQINPSASVEEALTTMRLRDYSQLVVSTGPREPKGIISYKSVAQAFLQGGPKRVSDCLDRSAPKVSSDDPLFGVVELFKKHDAVLVMGPDNSLVGIVTAADIAVEFGATAEPFLLIGQMEEQLRWLVRTRLPDLSAALAVVDASPGSDLTPSVSDLTMGQLHRVLDHDGNWAKVGIRFDRGVFCRELDAVRELRNAIMHFRDPPDKNDLERIKGMANLIKAAYEAAVTQANRGSLKRRERG